MFWQMAFPFISFRLKYDMIKKYFLLSFFLVLPYTDIYSQSRIEVKQIFFDAESWILFEDYKEALPLYQQLLRIDPSNSNYKYRIGQCYINTPGEKDKAISYLEDAVENINPDYREGKFREKGAPYDALYYLANAYRINNQLEKAILTYNLFKKNLDADVYDSNVVNLQIRSCYNAIELMNQPLFIREKNLSDQINESNSEFNPVVSDDEDMLFFSRGEAFYDAILYSARTSSGWGNPLNMNELLKVDRDLFPTSLSEDGKTLYLYSSADYDGIIYSSSYRNGSWQPIVKLNDNINTKYWESHATISHDDKRLFFTSNRKGTYGGLDIYVSERDSSGDWGPARNLGPVINTPYNEESPFLSSDDKTLFFSSRGHFNMGGYDIFYSTFLPDGTLSIPLNAGYPLNSTDDDVFFKPVKNGYEGYFAKESPDGYGKQDIYRIEIFSDDHPRKFFVRGIVKIADLMSSFNDSVKVSAMNIKNPDQTVIVYSDPETGEYSFEIPHGKYEVSFESDRTRKLTKDMELSLNYPADSFVLPGTILPKTDFVADLNVGSNQNIVVSNGDSILFPLRVERDSRLEVEHWSGDSLLYSEEFILRDSVFNYKLAPGQGNNRIVFGLTDKFSNITTTEIFITREEQRPLIRPEYTHIIALKQLTAFTEMLKSRSTEDVKEIINELDPEDKRFGNVDDIITFIREEALKKNIPSEKIDILSLRVAVMDNVLTQAAVDYMTLNADEKLSKLLQDIDIYEANLKTWTDLQKYIMVKTNGEVTPEELNKIAAMILSGSDPAVPLLKEKILAYAKYSDDGNIIRQSTEALENENNIPSEKWLSLFKHETLSRGLTISGLSRLIAAIAGMPGTTTEEFLSELIQFAEEPLLSYLKDFDLKKEKIKTPSELISFLLDNPDKSTYTEEVIFKALSEMINANNIPETGIEENAGDGRRFPWFIIVAGGGVALIIILLSKKRRK